MLRSVRRCWILAHRRTIKTIAVWRLSTTRRRRTVTLVRSASRCCCTTVPTSESSTTIGTPNCTRSAVHPHVYGGNIIRGCRSVVFTCGPCNNQQYLVSVKSFDDDDDDDFVSHQPAIFLLLITLTNVKNPHFLRAYTKRLWNFATIFGWTSCNQGRTDSSNRSLLSR